MKRILVYTTLLLTASGIYSQAKENNMVLKYSHKLTIGSDLIQPILLKGFNVNVTYMTNRFVFDYSHGINLVIGTNIQTNQQKNLNASLEIPYTTGLGLGYRFTNALDARVDFKAHKLEVNLLNGQQNLNYTQYTLGPGIFYRFYFGKKTGFGLEASARYWLDLGNNFINGDFEFTNNDGTTRIFDTDLNSGFGANIALIYTFGKSK